MAGVASALCEQASSFSGSLVRMVNNHTVDAWDGTLCVCVYRARVCGYCVQVHVCVYRVHVPCACVHVCAYACVCTHACARVCGYRVYQHISGNTGPYHCVPAWVWGSSRGPLSMDTVLTARS